MSEPGSMIRSLSGRPAARNYHSYVISEVGLGIASGRFPVGSTLPGDGEMMDRYGVSRTVLREAMKTIEAKGLVEARAKVGTRVLPRGRWNLYDRQVLTWVHEAGPDRAFVEAALDMRAMVERQTATLAAGRRSAEQMRMLAYWQNQRLATAAMPEPHALAEFELHRILCEAAQDPFLRAANALVEFAVLRATLPRMLAELEDLAAEKSPHYEALLNALGSARPEPAAAAMEQILALDRAWALRGV